MGEILQVSGFDKKVNTNKFYGILDGKVEFWINEKIRFA